MPELSSHPDANVKCVGLKFTIKAYTWFSRLQVTGQLDSQRGQ